jgi:predicted CopG family antitoxin
MTQISVKLRDEEYDLLQRLRGTKSTSDYIRDLLFADDKTVNKETEAFQNLFTDIADLKSAMAAFLKQLPNKEALLAVVAFLSHAMTIGNPTAYAHHTTELKQLFQTLKTTVNGGE